MSLTSSDLSISLSRPSDRLLVTLQGNLDTHSAPALGDVLLAAAECKEHTVLVDLAGVEFIDSSGLTVLLSAQRHLGRSGGGLIAVDPSPSVTRLFDITCSDKTIPVVRRDHGGRSDGPMFPPRHVPL